MSKKGKERKKKKKSKIDLGRALLNKTPELKKEFKEKIKTGYYEEIAKQLVAKLKSIKEKIVTFSLEQLEHKPYYPDFSDSKDLGCEYFKKLKDDYLGAYSVTKNANNEYYNHQIIITKKKPLIMVNNIFGVINLEKMKTIIQEKIPSINLVFEKNKRAVDSRRNAEIKKELFGGTCKFTIIVKRQVRGTKEELGYIYLTKPIYPISFEELFSAYVKQMERYYVTYNYELEIIAVQLIIKNIWKNIKDIN